MVVIVDVFDETVLGMLGLGLRGWRGWRVADDFGRGRGVGGEEGLLLGEELGHHGVVRHCDVDKARDDDV